MAPYNNDPRAPYITPHPKSQFPLQGLSQKMEKDRQCLQIEPI